MQKKGVVKSYWDSEEWLIIKKSKPSIVTIMLGTVDAI